MGADYSPNLLFPPFQVGGDIELFLVEVFEAFVLAYPANV